VRRWSGACERCLHVQQRVIQLRRFIEFRRLPILRIGFRQRLVSLRRGGGCAEGCDLDDLASEEHVRQAKAAADQPAVAKQTFHFLRQRIRSDVEILRLHADQQIAHAAANQERFEAAIAQAVQHAQRVGRDVGAGDGVLGPRDDPGRCGGRGERLFG
jgi:hypothetical protein